MYTVQGISDTSSQTRLCILGGGSTSNNLNQFASNDSLSGTVVKNLELVDHVTSVLRGIVHSISAGRLLAGVALSKSPVERVGEGVFAQVAKDLIVNLEGRKVRYISCQKMFM